MTRSPGYEGTVLALAFSPDGQTLASGGAGFTIRVWNVATRQEVFKLRELTGRVLSLAFSPDGKTLAAADQDQTIKRWETTTWKLLTAPGQQ